MSWDASVTTILKARQVQGKFFSFSFLEIIVEYCQ